MRLGNLQSWHSSLALIYFASISGSLTCCICHIHNLTVFPAELEGVLHGPAWSARGDIVKIPPLERLAQALTLVSDEADCGVRRIVSNRMQHLHQRASSMSGFNRCSPLHWREGCRVLLSYQLQDGQAPCIPVESDANKDVM